MRSRRPACRTLPSRTVRDAELAADLPDVRVLALEREGRRARRHAQRPDPRQRVDDLFGHAVAEVLGPGVRAHVAEGKHGDRGRLRPRPALRAGSARPRPESSVSRSTTCRAKTRSRADWKRSSGLFSSRCLTIGASSGGTTGPSRSRTGRPGGSPSSSRPGCRRGRRAARSASRTGSRRARRGRCAGRRCCPRICSGAMKPGVPTTIPVSVTPASSAASADRDSPPGGRARSRGS